MEAEDSLDPIDRLYEESNGSAVTDYLRQELAKARPAKRRRAAEGFFLAGVSGIPWVGAVVSVGMAMKNGATQSHINDLLRVWLEKHADKLDLLNEALEDTFTRIEALGAAVYDRIESDEYLLLVRKAFRVWDEADTEEKRRYVGNLIGNAAGTNIVEDDVVSLFIEWLSRYHEFHFALIREIYRCQNEHTKATRLATWHAMHPGSPLPRQDSAEADLFRLLFRDLSTGGVIRQARAVNGQGDFLRTAPARRPRGAPLPATVGTTLDDTDEYVLTALGENFVHYAITEVVHRISAAR